MFDMGEGWVGRDVVDKYEFFVILNLLIVKGCVFFLVSCVEDFEYVGLIIDDDLFFVWVFNCWVVLLRNFLLVDEFGSIIGKLFFERVYW